MGDPWWMTAARLMALIGMGYGAWEGYRRLRADKRKKAEDASSGGNKGTDEQ